MKHKTLATRLRTARINKNLTLRQLSAKTKNKVSNPYISQLELGHNVNPSPHKLYELAAALKIEYLELMELAGYIVKGARK